MSRQNKALPVKVLPGPVTLDVLADEINLEHERCEADVRSALGHALKIGALLAEAKSQVKHGEWQPWVSRNCKFSPRTARAYQRVHRKLPKTAIVADLTLSAAIRLVTQSPFDHWAEAEEARLEKQHALEESDSSKQIDTIKGIRGSYTAEEENLLRPVILPTDRLVSKEIGMEIGSLKEPPGTRAWSLAVQASMRRALHDVESGSQSFAEWITLFRDHKGWLSLTDKKGKPFATYEDFCLSALGYSSRDIEYFIGVGDLTKSD